MRKLFYILLAAIICPVAANAMAKLEKQQPFTGIPGADTGIVSSNHGIIAYDYERYYVTAKNDSIVVNLKDTSEAYVIKRSASEYFQGIYKNLLFMDSGTGPDRRQILIYDLVKKKKVYQSFYELPIAITKWKHLLTYWTAPYANALASANKIINDSEWHAVYRASTRNCQDYTKITRLGLTPTIEIKMFVDLINFESKGSDNVRCVARQ